MLLVTDLDGTLLTSQKTISPRTRQALVEFRQRGGLLAACSARPVSSMVRLLQQQQVDKLFAWCAGFNGGQILEMTSQHMIHTATLSCMALREIDQSLSCYPHHFLAPMLFIIVMTDSWHHGRLMRPTYLSYPLFRQRLNIFLISMTFIRSH